MHLILVARHGETPDSLAGLINADPRRQGSLTEEGRAQAARLGRSLLEEPLEACFTSEFTRTIETADIALHERSVPRFILRELNENRAGSAFEGRPLKEYVEWCLGDHVFQPPPGTGGDRLVDTLLRYLDGLEYLAGRPERVALVITHGVAVGLTQRLVNLTAGEKLYPLPVAEPATMHRVSVPDLLVGIGRARERVAHAAATSPAGIAWAAQRQPRPPARITPTEVPA